MSEATLFGLRGYGLGERNPKTLPGVYADSETPDQNRARTRFWTSLRKKVEKGAI